MFISNYIRFDSTLTVVEQEGFDYTGEIAECCGGPSVAQQNLAAEQASFYQTLTNDYSQQFAQQSAVLKSLQSVFTPILQAGPDQYGFSTSEDAALRTQASEGTAANYRAANTALGNEIAASSGNTSLPSGATQQAEAQVNSAAANQESQQQLAITQAGYQQGSANFNEAASALGSAAGQYTSGFSNLAGSSNTAGNNAFSSATTLYQESQQNSFANIAGGILGGAVGAFTGAAGTSLGEDVGL